jgi:flavin-binding protein dodecin
MNTLPLDAFASLPPDKLAESLGDEYTGASPESLRALADALVRRDEAAYKVAMAEVMAQSMKIRVDKVENIVVKGDTATADVTLVIGAGGKVNYTEDPTQVVLVKEDGQWKDCTPQDAE